MQTHRAEIGAILDHICVQSANPRRLAKFYAEAYAMTLGEIAGGWRCDAPGRTLLVISGRQNSVAYFAYSFANRATLEAHRARLQTCGKVFDRNPSSIFDDSAFSVADPDGNLVVFGFGPSDVIQTDERLPARLQHCAFRTTSLAAMVEFYSSLGFVVSDRVEDDDGVLRACFLRTDHEHHALALFGSPETRLDHISCETGDVVALIGWADRMSSKRIPLYWGVGRHGPGNDMFFMVKDPDENLIEISVDLELCESTRPAGRWRHEPRTLNLWGTAIMRS